MNVPITSEQVLKALGYLIAVADAGVVPSRATLDTYAMAPFPRSAREKFLSGAPRENLLMTAMFRAEHSDDSTTDYLISTGLAEKTGGGTQVTELGRSFYVGAARLADITEDSGVLEVVGHLDDPVINARVLIEIGKLNAPLLIDPYLPASALFDVFEHAEVRRVLAADPFAGRKIAGQTRDERRRDVGTVLSAYPDAEVRLVSAESKFLHDRLALPGAGSGLMIGASLGGTQLTVVSHLSGHTTDLLRMHYETIWKQADPIGTSEPNAVRTEG